MNKIKVYDVDGKHVDSFTLQKEADTYRHKGHKIAYLNSKGFYVKGQTTSKGIKIK